MNKMDLARKLYNLPDDLTRGAGIIPISTKTGRILLSLRGENQEEPLTWASWGGVSLVGENPYQTAMREFHEETLYSGHTTLFPCCEQSDPITNFCYTTFIGVISEEFVPILDCETKDFLWVTLSELYSNKLKLHSKFKLSLIDAKSTLKNILLTFDILNE